MQAQDENSKELETTLLLVRHGDRWDFAHKEWRDQMKLLGQGTFDPPLSVLGHVQARETASELAKETGIDAILCSPYLRTIQTAQPTADLLGLPLFLEEGIAECMHSPNWLPSTAERYFYFPQVDPNYLPIHTIQAEPENMNKFTGMPSERWPDQYLKRFIEFSGKFESQYLGKKVVCFSHAASTALVAALIGSDSVIELGKFAPCGFFKVVKRGDGPWKLIRRGDSNDPYVTNNSTTTRPWGFEYDAKNDEIWKSMKLEACSAL